MVAERVSFRIELLEGLFSPTGDHRAFRPLDLREVVAGAVDAARPLLGPAHRLTHRCEERPVPVVGDPEPLSGVVGRLLDNAIRYSPEGGPIHVTVGRERDAAVCRVIDRGIGIAEADLPTLFAPFGRVHNGRTRGAQGVGLGLHLCRELALLHGGDVVVESEPGVGTSVSLVLPRLGAPAAASYDVGRFGAADTIWCSAAFREIGEAATSFEDAAARMVRQLRDRLRNGPGGEPAAPLVRLFRSRPLHTLDAGLRARTGGGLDPETPCLVLVASAGEREEWNFPDRSAGHRVIPLPAGGWWPPMVSGLVRQMGLDPVRAADPAAAATLAHRTCNVFHVAEADGSPWVPAQEEFVRPHGIRSVIGFGGLLARSDLFAVVIFSRREISRGSAPMFRAVSHTAKLVLRRFA